MILIYVLSLCLAIGNGILPDMPTTVDSDINSTIEANVSQGHTTLKEIFREVEELMEDTQHKLDAAVHQVDNESSRAQIQNASDFHNDSFISANVNVSQTIPLPKEGEKPDNATIEAFYPKDEVQTSKENNIEHECIVNEDCDDGTYCLYESHHSKCLPCKELDRSCSRDDECCSGHLCIWGQCSQNSTKGERGTICHQQSDCSPDLCCVIHKSLLFPVCNSKPVERERCFISPNHLMALLSSDLESEGPREHCPCAGDLHCQHMGRGSLCLRPQNSSEEELTDAFYSEIDYII